MNTDQSAATEWDEWIGLHASRNEVAENYATGLRTHGMSWPHWPDVNAAILRRWSPSGLNYIKERAWKLARTGATDDARLPNWAAAAEADDA